MSSLKINLPDGKYVAAVSGGVDSMVLLDLLYQDCKLQKASYKLIIAHIDHGIRSDSKEDRIFVERKAKELRLEFVCKEANLGPGTSEEAARKARYDFLFGVKEKHGAKAVITAHHQDDLLETAVINILRGTGPRGLASLKSRPGILRPLLGYSKSELINYAEENNLKWREDPSNQDRTYLRNYVRHDVLPRLSSNQKVAMLQNIRTASEQVEQLNEKLSSYFGMFASSREIDRYQFIMLPHDVSKEVMAEWLRKNKVRNISSKMIDRLVVAAKTYLPDSLTDVNKEKILKISSRKLELNQR